MTFKVNIGQMEIILIEENISKVNLFDFTLTLGGDLDL